MSTAARFHLGCTLLAIALSTGCGHKAKPPGLASNSSTPNSQSASSSTGETGGDLGGTSAQLVSARRPLGVPVPPLEQKLRDQEARADDLPRVLMATTKGEMVIELYENEAPNTVANFISLVEKGFYNGTKFHRVLDGFMAQGGDPTGTGKGGPGYKIRCECYQANARLHYPATLSMAHAGRDTGGSQFFLTFTTTTGLDRKHTAFGRVIHGDEVLARIQRIDPEHPQPGEVPDMITEARVLRKRDHEYKPEIIRIYGRKG